MDLDRVAVFVGLSEQIHAVEETLDRLKKEKGTVERDLLKAFEAAGVSNVRCNGHTVYLHRKLAVRAKEGNRGRVILALRAAGLDDYVTCEPAFNTSSLEAYVKVELDEGRELPQPLKEALECTELFFVRTRKA